MKTKGIYGNELIITQTAHGTQNGKALDSKSPLIAMEDVYVYDYHHIVQWHPKVSRNTEQQSYFYVRMANSDDYYIVVHAFPVKTGLVKKGEEVGKMHWYWSWETGARADHFHTCANIAGTGWVESPCVLDQSIVKLTWAYGGDHWSTKYSNYRDLSINIKGEMVNSFPAKCKVLYDDTLVRPEPNRTKDPLRKITSGTILEVSGYATGENVNGGNVWCYIGDGYVHKSLLALDNTQELELAKLKTELSVANTRISEQDNTIKTLTIQADEFEAKEAEYVAAIDSLEIAVDTLEVEVDKLNKTIKTLEAEIILLKKQLTECQEGNDEDSGLWRKLVEIIKKLFGWIKPDSK